MVKITTTWEDLDELGDIPKFNLKSKKRVCIENIQQRILCELMHTKIMTFNELWNKEGRSNNFAYHLKKLECDGLVEKSTNGYQLTIDGKKEVAYLESDTGNVCKQPILAVINVIVNEQKGTVLMLDRTKEPFSGYFGLNGGKLCFSKYLLEEARESIKNDTGLKCDVELKGLFSSKTFVDEELTYNHQLFVIKATNHKGNLIEKTRKGDNRWMNLNEVSKVNTLPNIQLFGNDLYNRHKFFYRSYFL